MTNKKTTREPAGYFGIGTLRPNNVKNVGTLWRSAHAMGAAFIFSIRDRFPPEAQRNLVAADPTLAHPGDTPRTWRKIPYMTYTSVEALKLALPLCRLVGIEMTEGAVDLPGYTHPDRAIYLLGSEIDGLTPPALAACDDVVSISTEGSLNVAVTGSLVLYDRLAKRGRC